MRRIHALHAREVLSKCFTPCTERTNTVTHLRRRKLPRPRQAEHLCLSLFGKWSSTHRGLETFRACEQKADSFFQRGDNGSSWPHLASAHPRSRRRGAKTHQASEGLSAGINYDTIQAHAVPRSASVPNARLASSQIFCATSIWQPTAMRAAYCLGQRAARAPKNFTADTNAKFCKAHAAVRMQAAGQGAARATPQLSSSR